MYKRAYIALLFLVIVITAGTLFYFFSLDERDERAYAALKRLTETKFEESRSSQNKREVRKEIFSSRLHMRILSEASEMTWVRSLGKNELLEEMRGVEALMQEEIKKGSQIIRRLLAETATYDFKNEKLIAQKVKLYRYEIPGEVLPEKISGLSPLQEGEAIWAEVYLKEGRIDLNASIVSMHFDEKQMDASAQSLLFDGKVASLAGDVTLSHPIGRVVADTGQLIYDKDLQEATFADNVHFVSSEGVKINCQSADLEFEKGTSRIDRLILFGDVVVVDPAKGTLTTDKCVTVEMGLKAPRRVICRGPSIMTHVDEAEKKSHTLLSPGDIVVDHEAKVTYLSSTPAAQIHYTDPFGEIFADSGRIFYEKGEGALKIKSILLEGKVFMAHSFPSALPSEVERSYAYADRAEYFPATFEMVLEGDKVLIYDKINQVEVAAPKIHVRRDQATKKQTIRGEGEVRLTLEEKEFQMLKNRFKLEEK